ncbi:MAG: hypothetical protein JXP34_00020 [Planctomycetes bacterium]|nr:hypothetical protein [Planctomycetota bacterium]
MSGASTIVALLLLSASPRESALERIRALYERLLLAPRDSYLNYAIATTARRAGIDLREERIRFPLVPVVTGDPAARTDLFGLTTGAHAIQESLQLAVLMSPARARASRMVPLAELVPPRVPVHAAKAPEGARGDEEARLVPQDWLFIRFASGRDLVAMLREADLWIGHAISFYQTEGRVAGVLWKPFHQLGLPHPFEASVLYESIAGPIAVAIADPFLREGTDVTAILPRDLPAALAGRVSRHGAEIAGRVVISTSEVALDRIAEVAEDPGASLAASPEYLSMRSSLAPVEGEAAFAFLSDGFVRHLVSPRAKILESRRVRCAANLRMIVNAALLSADENGRAPEDIDALFEEGYLERAKLVCPQGGSYTLEGGIEPSCSVHDKLGHLTPNIELALADVTDAEAQAYRRYARAYEALWRRYVDPVGIRFAREDRSWTIETIVLPLAENSVYQNLVRLAGGRAIEGGAGPVAPSTVLLFSTRLDDAFIRGFGDDPFDFRARFGADLRDAFQNAFGDRLTVGLLDDRLLFDYDLAGFFGESIRWSVSRAVLMTPLLAAMNLPAYATIPVRDRVAAERFLGDLRRGAAEAGARPAGGRYALKIENYACGRDGVAFEALTLEIASIKIRVFYALARDAFVLATRPEVLEAVIAGGVRDADPDPYSVKLSLYPSRWERIRPDMLLGYEESARAACLRSLIERRPFAAIGFEKVGAALGFDHRCPDGGTYEMVGDELRCSIHGTPEAPRQRAAPAAGSQTMRALDGLREIRFDLRFIPEGLRSRVRIERR